MKEFGKGLFIFGGLTTAVLIVLFVIVTSFVNPSSFLPFYVLIYVAIVTGFIALLGISLHLIGATRDR